jgi:hypothetical protein
LGVRVVRVVVNLLYSCVLAVVSDTSNDVDDMVGGSSDLLSDDLFSDTNHLVAVKTEPIDSPPSTPGGSSPASTSSTPSRKRLFDDMIATGTLQLVLSVLLHNPHILCVCVCVCVFVCHDHRCQQTLDT